MPIRPETATRWRGIGLFVTDVAQLNARLIPAALALFGVGMTVSKSVGGWLANRHPSQGLVAGFGSALVVLALLALGGDNWA